jgi:hypothetical protein
VAVFRKRVLERVSLEDFDAIIDALVEHAKDGNVAAAKLLLPYLLGKPSTTVDAERLDDDSGACPEFSLASAKPTPEAARQTREALVKELGALLAAGPPSTNGKMTDAVNPAEEIGLTRPAPQTPSRNGKKEEPADSKR